MHNIPKADGETKDIPPDGEAPSHVTFLHILSSEIENIEQKTINDVKELEEVVFFRKLTFSHILDKSDGEAPPLDGETPSGSNFL